MEGFWPLRFQLIAFLGFRSLLPYGLGLGVRRSAPQLFFTVQDTLRVF